MNGCLLRKYLIIVAVNNSHIFGDTLDPTVHEVLNCEIKTFFVLRQGVNNIVRDLGDKKIGTKV